MTHHGHVLTGLTDNACRQSQDYRYQAVDFAVGTCLPDRTAEAVGGESRPTASVSATLFVHSASPQTRRINYLPVLKLHTTPVVVPPAFTSSIRQ